MKKKSLILTNIKNLKTNEDIEYFSLGKWVEDKNIAISKNEMRATKSTYLPTIGLVGSYGWNESINDNPYAFYNKSISDGFSAGINLRWDIFRGGKKIIANKNSKLNIANSEILKESTVFSMPLPRKVIFFLPSKIRD